MLIDKILIKDAKKKKKKRPKKWIPQNLKKGAFTKQAKAAGMTVLQFARHVIANKKRYSKTTVRRAYLALTFAKMARKKKRKKRRK